MRNDPDKLFRIDASHKFKRRTIAEDMNEYADTVQGAAERRYAHLQGFRKLAPDDARLPDEVCRAFSAEFGRETSHLDDDCDAEEIDAAYQELMWRYTKAMSASGPTTEAPPARGRRRAGRAAADPQGREARPRRAELAWPAPDGTNWSWVATASLRPTEDPAIRPDPSDPSGRNRLGLKRWKVEAIKRVIRRGGWLPPLVADACGDVSDGHHRLAAALGLGLPRVAVRGRAHPLSVRDDA